MHTAWVMATQGTMTTAIPIRIERYIMGSSYELQAGAGNCGQYPVWAVSRNYGQQDMEDHHSLPFCYQGNWSVLRGRISANTMATHDSLDIHVLWQIMSVAHSI